MAAIRYTRLAESDLYEIGVYTLRTWGADQTASYLQDMEDACLKLADNRKSDVPATTYVPAFAVMSRANT